MTQKISIITATFNSINGLPRCIESINRQSYMNREHIIIDGASTDGTVEFCYENQDKFSFFSSQKDSGVYEALNKGIAASSGDVIGFLHSDDVFASDDVLSAVAEAFEDKTLIGVYGDLKLVKRTRQKKTFRSWKSKSFKPYMLYLGWMPPHPTLFLRKCVYDELGGFDVEYSICSDYQFILKVFSKPNINIKYLPILITEMQTGGLSNRSLKLSLIKHREDWSILKNHGFGFFTRVFSFSFKKISKLVQYF